MTPTSEFHRRIRKQIRDATVNADVSADVNVVVATGNGTARAHQDAPITQTSRRRTGPAQPEETR